MISAPGLCLSTPLCNFWALPQNSVGSVARLPQSGQGSRPQSNGDPPQIPPGHLSRWRDLLKPVWSGPAVPMLPALPAHSRLTHPHGFIDSSPITHARAVCRLLRSAERLSPVEHYQPTRLGEDPAFFWADRLRIRCGSASSLRTPV